MSPQELLAAPAWQAESLGQPLPGSRHAVSVALPCWADVVGYEEKLPRVISRLQAGYPRFVIHSLVEAVAQALGGGRPCLPFPSRSAAAEAEAFVREQGFTAEMVVRRGMHGVITDGAGAPALKAFWQHTGLIVSSRRAEAWLQGRGAPVGLSGVARALRQQLAGYYDCSEDDVFLAPTGMAAQFAALKAVQRRRPGFGTAQLGFPYVDTLKLQEKLGHGGHLIHDLSRIGEELRALAARGRTAACFAEVPGNPLLGSPDLREVTPILREHGIPFVADDVVATPLNVDLSGHADLIATSLTKYVVGSCDAMGGALICNPRSPYHAELRQLVAVHHEELLWDEDAEVVERQGRTFPERMRQHNKNGLLIAQRLQAHPSVERVWFPKWEFREAYEAVRRPGGGYGSLVTFLPRNAETMSQQIYDRLHVSKGPSLGTLFTLACPFTLLAHYTELGWAESCGVSRFLIRVSVGLEEAEELWARFESALGGVASR